MSRLSRQLLSLFIALALVLSPLQGMAMNIAPAGADAASSMHHEMLMGQMSMDDGMYASTSHDMTQMASMPDGDCEQCDTSNCCAGAQCLSGHCATCVIGILPQAPVLSEAVVWVATIAAESAHLPQLTDTLFRPPRV
jgi:hypothetical protein